MVFRYCSENAEIDKISNPNGSVDNIAGVMNLEGNVLGMMPHPERNMEMLLGSGHGIKILKSLVEHFNQN